MIFMTVACIYKKKKKKNKKKKKKKKQKNQKNHLSNYNTMYAPRIGRFGVISVSGGLM